ncbi:hypothetical protein EXT47_03890, partial [Pseudoalteromonas sp. CO342X]
TAPAGSQIIQSQGNITIKGSGSGNLTLANGGSEISIDSSGNVNIFADKLLTLKGKAMTVFDGSMEQILVANKAPLCRVYRKFKRFLRMLDSHLPPMALPPWRAVPLSCLTPIKMAAQLWARLIPFDLQTAQS